MLCQGCPGMVNVGISLRAQALTAVMGRHGAPALRRGNWLEMMGHKHTSQEHRSDEQTANQGSLSTAWLLFVIRTHTHAPHCPFPSLDIHAF